MVEPIELARHLVDTIEDKKGEDIVLIDIHAQSMFADYFVLCSCTSERQLKAVEDAVIETAEKEYDVSPYHIEGNPDNGWVLLDYIDVIVHIFSESQRRYYDLESLWKESPLLLRVQ